MAEASTDRTLQYDTPPDLRPLSVLHGAPREPSADEFGPFLPISRGLQAAWFVIAWSVYAIIVGCVLSVILVIFRSLL